MPDKAKAGGVCQLDRGKLAQSGTIWLALFQEEKLVRDLVGGANLANPGGFVVDECGSVVTFNGSQQGNLAFALPAGVNLENVVIAARIKATATQAGAPGQAFGLCASLGTQNSIGVGFDPSNNVGGTYLSSSGAGMSAYNPGAQNRYYTIFAQLIQSGGASYQKAWIDGRPATANQGATIPGAAATGINEICIGAQHRSAGFLRQFKGNIEWASIIVLNGASGAFSMTDELAQYLYASNYPYNLQVKKSSIWLAATGGGAVTHATSGAPTADAASTAGAATRYRQHSASGACAADAATVAATSARTRQHATSGAPTSDASIIAGVATRYRQYATTGAAAADAATISATSARYRQHATTGAAAADAATIDGQAALPGAVTHTTTGGLTASDALAVGVSRHQSLHAASGASVADAAAVDGSAARVAGTVTHATIGALSASSAIVVGAAVQHRVHAASGSLSAGGAGLSGLAAVGAVIPDQPAVFALRISRTVSFSGNIERTVNYRASYG